jgi:hypothetical protein
MDREVAGPPVLIVGGLLTSPSVYWRMADRLRARGAAFVEIAPIWTPDWFALAALGHGRLLRRTGRAIVGAYRRAGSVPVLVVGHSAGGVLARLAMSPVPYRGSLAAVARGVGALVTLGTPHHVVRTPEGSRMGGAAAAFLDERTPGAYFAPATGYVTVAGSRVRGAPAGIRDRDAVFAGSSYARLLGEDGRTEDGDGVIPVRAAHLDGATQITLPGVIHGPAMRAPWYGDDRVIDAWWPTAVEAWRGALAGREAWRASRSDRGGLNG